MFIRKLYYDMLSGMVLSSRMMRGAVVITSRDEDIKTIPYLVPYQDHPQDLGLFQWTEPDPEVEKNMAVATGIRVDVSVTPHVIVYDFTPIQRETLTADEVVQIVTGEVE